MIKAIGSPCDPKSHRDVVYLPCLNGFSGFRLTSFEDDAHAQEGR